MDIGALEDAIIARLTAARAALPYRLPTIESYGGQLDDDVQATFQLPALFVTFAGENLIKMLGERSREMEVEFVIYCVAYNTGNERATRHGDLHNAGSYQLMHDVVAVMSNQAFGLLTRAMKVTKCTPMFTARKQDGAKAQSVIAVHATGVYQFKSDITDCAHPTEIELHGIASGFYLKPGNDSNLDPNPANQYPDLATTITSALSLVTSTINYLTFPFTFVRDLQATFQARVGALFGAVSAFSQLARAGFSLSSMWSVPIGSLTQALFPAAASATDAPTPAFLTTHAAIQSSLAVADASALVFAAEIGDPLLTPVDIDTIAADVRSGIADAIARVRACYPDIDESRPLVEGLKASALAVQEAGLTLLRSRPPFIERPTTVAGNLRLVAFAWYGDAGRALELLRFNPQIRNPNFIAPGTVLKCYAR